MLPSFFIDIIARFIDIVPNIVNAIIDDIPNIVDALVDSIVDGVIDDIPNIVDDVVLLLTSYMFVFIYSMMLSVISSKKVQV